jgi:hypothetical protein
MQVYLKNAGSIFLFGKLTPFNTSVCSIWTVDLAYLLNKFSVSFSFCTVTLGANPQYSAESFYRVLVLTNFYCTRLLKFTSIMF